MIEDKFQICMVGWYFYSFHYKKMKEYFPDIYVIAHRYDKILDELKFNYSIIKNVGVEWHCYNWFIKNIWDRKSHVLFMHDDMNISKNIFSDIYDKCRKYDVIYFFNKRRDFKKKSFSERFFCLSPFVINLFLKKYNGIWFDKYNKGYIVGEKKMYDERYNDEKYLNFTREKGQKFKITLKYFINKYSLRNKRLFYKEIVAYRRGQTGKKLIEDEAIMENTIFNKRGDIEGIVLLEEKEKKMRKEYLFLKWLNFYFYTNHLDKLDILIFGDFDNFLIELLNKYFKYSNIYILGDKQFSLDIDNDRCKFFKGEVDIKMLKKISEESDFGLDIIIDNQNNNDEKRIEVFNFLLKELNPAGSYIISNLILQNGFSKILNFLSSNINALNFNGKIRYSDFYDIIKENRESLTYHEILIDAIHFYPETCYVFKKFLK